MKKRVGEPWIPASQLATTLTGLGLNLLVSEVDLAVRFQNTVLGAEVIYADPDFALMQAMGSRWMLHAIHSYERHPFRLMSETQDLRGRGVELRLYGLDPDQVVVRARDFGAMILVDPQDKRHGFREAYIRCADGYTWVPSLLLPAAV